MPIIDAIRLSSTSCPAKQEGFPMHSEDQTQAIASQFAAARKAAVGLSEWPGGLPESLAAAYDLQRATQIAWGEATGGVKVGRVLGAWTEEYGVDRFTGPIASASIQRSDGGQILDFPVISGGSALLECEIIAVLAADIPDALTLGSDVLDAAAIKPFIASLHIGIEVAGSPMARINDLGPLASIACFGNNNGAILGQDIEHWHAIETPDFRCEASIDGKLIASGGPERLPGGVWTAIAFALTQQARLGSPLRKGQIICTGALTGMHPITAGQTASADFGKFGRVTCRAVEQLPARG
jgi:2-keto-4-pentenoate hydratase